VKGFISSNWREHLSEKEREGLESAFKFAAKELGIVDDKFKCYIVLCDKIDSEDGVLVFGDYTNYPYEKRGRIRISTKYCRSFLKSITLFHEMVHAKQFYNRELMVYTVGIAWKGKFVKQGTKYKDLPYEIEARKLEKKLFLKWIVHRFTKWLKS